jgi:uncharacterized protein (TIGR02421 family)
MEHARLIKIDDMLYKIKEKLTLDIIHPVNIAEEKEKFLKSNWYNPKFNYNDMDIDFEKDIRAIKGLKFESSIMDLILKEYSKELYNYLMMFKYRGDEKFTSYSIKIYGRPDSSLIKIARQFLNVDTKKIYVLESKYDSEETVDRFKKILVKSNFNWEVALKKTIANASVNPSKKMMVVKKGKHFNKSQFKRLVAHEIFTHILRAECGSLQPYKIFSTGLAGYESTEEGLALYKEKKTGNLTSSLLKGYAGRVIAINIGLKHSFRNTFNFLRKYYGKEKSWTLTVRVKRGLINTSKAGGFTKDLIYLKGYLEILDFLKKHNGIKTLHYGKIGIHHVKLIPKIKGLKDPDTIKNKCNLEEYKNLFW